MRDHVYFFTMATTMWALFYLAGLPSDYFLDWPFLQQLGLIVAAPSVVLGALGAMRFRRQTRAAALRTAAIMAFHFTVPLLAYDWWLLGVQLGLGWSFIQSHWYLSVFYVIPWLMLPPIAFVCARPNPG